MNVTSREKSSLMVRALMALAFFALPLIFTGFELLALRQSLAEEADAHEGGMLLTSLRTLKDRRNLQGICQNYFNAGMERAAKTGVPRQEIARMHREASTLFGFPMEFLFLLPDGRPDEELSDVRLPEELIPFLASDLQHLETQGKNRAKEFNKRIVAYQDFFGPWVYRLTEGRSPVGMHLVRLEEKRQSVYISTPSSFGRLLVFLDKPIDWDNRQIQWEVLQRLSQVPDERGAVVHSALSRRNLMRLLGPGFATGWRACMLMGPSTRRTIRVGDWLWAQVPIDQHSRVILGRPDTSQLDLARFRQRLMLVFTALFLGAAFVFFRLLAAPGGIPFRLSTRLFLLLAYTVGLPLLVYGLSARTLARDLDEVRQRQWHNRQVAVLEELDQRYLDYVGLMEETVRQRCHLTTSEGAAEANLQRIIEEVTAEFHPVSAVFLDPKGAARGAGVRTNFSIPPALQKLVFTACASVIGESERAGTAADDLAATLTSEYGVNAELLSSLITEHPETLLDFGFLSADLALLLNRVYTPDGNTPFAILTAWENRQLCRLFIRRFIHQFQARQPDIILAAQSVLVDSETVPANSPLFSPGESILQGFREAKRPLSIPVVLGTSTWLLTGYRGTLLKNVLCMAASPPDLREAATVAFHRRIILIGVLLTISGLIIARLLSSAFLGPIRQLAQGVDALARRDFSHRIPPIGQDELGQLGLAFNQMLEDLKDLELARILQERIYPAGVANLGHDWEVFGSCRSASEVGGDFFDFFPLSDGRWFLVIGDVSGHGTPSALIVAMAKGLFSHPRNLTDPGQILQDVQTVFGQVLPRKKMMMTCFVAVFDPATGHLQYSNAGHNFPFLVDQNGGQRQLQMKSFPLGFGKKPRNQHVDTQMEEGSFLFLYTDGLIEAIDRNNEMIGYEAVQAQLTTLLPLGAEDAVLGLRSWHDGQVGSGPQADDITLVVLKQRPGRNAMSELS